MNSWFLFVRTLNMRQAMVGYSSNRNVARLPRFEMGERWSVDLLKALYDAMPSIEMLNLHGGHVKDSLKALIPILSQFKKLKTLGLADVSYLHIGLRPRKCACSYTGHRGREILGMVRDQRRAANRRVTDMVFGTCVSLDVMLLGEYTKAVVTRCHGGQIQDIQWCKEQRQTIN
ncbi:hypothetical protein IW262DRAFT_305149 [Armillaria fumosa]|nr:hypothetical protein IW262DRAFT_305149 [Armillaria fumosa]